MESQDAFAAQAEAMADRLRKEASASLQKVVYVCPGEIPSHVVEWANTVTKSHLMRILGAAYPAARNSFVNLNLFPLFFAFVRNISRANVPTKEFFSPPLQSVYVECHCILAT